MKVCVIGGGAAGMMCATMIARRGHNVSLFEKNEKLGKKIYITGKGRCNVTNLTTGNEFLKNVVGGQKFVMGAITRFDSEDTMDFFEDVGVPLKVERGNRVFPVSDKSSDIIKGLEKAMRWAGVKVYLNSAVERICSKNIVEDSVVSDEVVYSKTSGYEKMISGVVVGGKEEKFDAVVVATGGVSYPLTGSTGDGYEFAKSMGHSIVSPVPALCAINLKDKDLEELEGLSLKNVKVICKENSKIIYDSEVGEMLFTRRGVSGPIILSASSFINRCDLNKLKMFIDFKPALTIDALQNRIDRDIASLKAKQISSLLEGFLPKSLVKVFAKRLNLNVADKANQLSKEKRQALIKMLKNFELDVLELDGFNSAVVTAGGVNLKEIVPKYMKSKIIQNLYFIGEVLDIDALTGGFNLQIAFSTAVTAASDFKDINY